MLMTKKDLILVAVVVLASVTAAAGTAPFGVWLSMVSVCVIGIASTVFVTLYCYRRIVREVRSCSSACEGDHRRIEDLIMLLTAIRTDVPLPPMRDYAIAPDFGNIIAREILGNRPRLIVEFGSGVSTLISAYCLKRLGAGRLLSIDHDAEYVERSRRNVAAHGLASIAEVKHAPLTKLQLDGKSWKYYDLSGIDNTLIDLLVIDGPPLSTQGLTRYPALALLVNRLSPTAVVLLDDAARADEKEIVRIWRERFPEFHYEFVGTERGTAIFRRQSITYGSSRCPF
jgi:predicted O-methyltransferase YrrM